MPHKTSTTSSEVPSFLGSLANFEHYDSTRHIGTVFSDKSTQLSQLLADPNSDVLIKDLATLVSHRGVVFFKAQDLNLDQQRELATRLGELSGKPETSKLHRHPIIPDDAELGKDIVVIGSGQFKAPVYEERRRASRDWHADITFEPIPSDYAILKLHTLPPSGGDTLWASAYEAYDRLSEPYRKFLEGLTAVHEGVVFKEAAKRLGVPLAEGPRGAPLNVGTDLIATQCAHLMDHSNGIFTLTYLSSSPVIRTNPVTGFKGLFVNRSFTKKIVELTADESDDVLDYLARHIAENHDLQVRYRWEQNDVAIWDNRSTFHSATHDFEAPRQGNRVISLGEKPYFDPNSKSRREALGLRR